MGNSRGRVALFITSFLDHFSKKRKECCMTHLFFLVHLTLLGLHRNSSNTPKSDSPIYSHSGDLQDVQILLLSGNVRHTSTEPQFLKTQSPSIT